MSRRRISTLDMTVQEQEHVRNALHWLHTKFGKWEHVAKMLKFEDTTVINCANGRRTIMASMAFRVARVVNVSVDELLAGRFPARGCPRCGYDPRESRRGS
jgi:rhodanese-related sulfurtransferase